MLCNTASVFCKLAVSVSFACFLFRRPRNTGCIMRTPIRKLRKRCVYRQPAPPPCGTLYMKTFSEFVYKRLSSQYSAEYNHYRRNASAGYGHCGLGNDVESVKNYRYKTYRRYAHCIDYYVIPEAESYCRINTYYERRRQKYRRQSVIPYPRARKLCQFFRQYDIDYQKHN